MKGTIRDFPQGQAIDALLQQQNFMFLGERVF
jgi:hypothetical protein